MKRTPLESSRRALRYGVGFAEIGGLQKNSFLDPPGSFFLGFTWVVTSIWTSVGGTRKYNTSTIIITSEVSNFSTVGAYFLLDWFHVVYANETC